MTMAETSFESRKKEEEAKYKHREELEFRVNARCNKLLGLWAAEQLGLGEDSAAAYAKEVVACALSAPDRAIEKVSEDLASKGVNIPHSCLQAEVDRLEGVARAQIIADAP